MQKVSHQLINADGGSDEYYTPMEIIDAARDTMGGIDTDVASSSEANKRIGALCFFDQHNDGLIRQWRGRVWMNHPFGKTTNRKWVNKLVSEYVSGRTTQAVCITFAATSERWFQPLIKHPQCFLVPRTNYLLPDGTIKKGVTKGSVVTYLGKNLDGFCKAFGKMGQIKVAINT